jgi:hypothetical protein
MPIVRRFVYGRRIPQTRPYRRRRIVRYTRPKYKRRRY